MVKPVLAGFSGKKCIPVFVIALAACVVYDLMFQGEY